LKTMAGSIARIQARSAICIRKAVIEFLALWFAITHPRVRWYAKLIALIPLGYMLSPLDLVPNALALFGIGQFDDILVVRYSYVLLKRVINPDILAECRERSNRQLGEGKTRKRRIIIGIAAAWTLIIMLLIWDIYKRLHRKGII
jgi:uncharacterized membrane protein YkvA (DUF1232 family)